MSIFLENLNPFKASESDILRNKACGKIYVSDFTSGKGGKYISANFKQEDEHYDIKLRISPKIEVRIAYIDEDNKITGVQITKLSGGKLEKMHLSTLDFKGVLGLLKIFSEIDLKSVATGKYILNKSIIEDNDDLKNALEVILSDENGLLKLKELAISKGLVIGDIKNLVNKKKSIEEFDNLLNNIDYFKKYKEENDIKQDEKVWQSFFENNDWFLGTDFVENVDERSIDTKNIVDFLMKSQDGFLEIIEIKNPNSENLKFWDDVKDHGNLIPSKGLIKAIIQCQKYLYEVEREIDSKKFQENTTDVPIVKPKITLIYGRSNNWEKDEKIAYRILNSSYLNLNIFTYDHLLERAKNILSLKTK